MADFFPLKIKGLAMMNETNGMPHVKTLAMCLQKMVSDGYVHDFSYADEGIMLYDTKKIYKPSEIKVINVMRFEGNADADDNAVLYTIETNDGVKGTLVDAFGIYGKEKVVI